MAFIYVLCVSRVLVQLAAGPPSPGDMFVANRALVSYVYTNPAPSTRLAEHDMVYVLRPDGGEGGDGDGDDDDAAAEHADV